MTIEITGGGILGEQVRIPRRVLDTFDAPVHHGNTIYSSDEVTAVCPITGQPDWYKVTIQVIGTRKLIESKSLKLYLQSFREEGMFCEEFASRITEDVKAATNADIVTVEVKQKARGGVEITTTSNVTRQFQAVELSLGKK